MIKIIITIRTIKVLKGKENVFEKWIQSFLFRFLTWALGSLCSSKLWMPKFSPSGDSTTCLTSPVQGWVDFERVWATSTSVLRELRCSVEPHGTLIWKLLYRSSSSLLSFTSADRWSGLLCRDDTSWLRASVLSLQVDKWKGKGVSQVTTCSSAGCVRCFVLKQAYSCTAVCVIWWCTSLKALTTDFISPNSVFHKGYLVVFYFTFFTFFLNSTEFI